MMDVLLATQDFAVPSAWKVVSLLPHSYFDDSDSESSEYKLIVDDEQLHESHYECCPHPHKCSGPGLPEYVGPP